jgi:hypothetical protein
MVKREFIVERQGRSFVLYAGLLDLAHSQGLRAIRTRLVQVPADDNALTAIVSAEVETDRGTFSGIGDANPANVSRAMLSCTIRLAETRAKARALRDAVNVGVTAFEELGEQDDSPAAPLDTRPMSSFAGSSTSSTADEAAPTSGNFRSNGAAPAMGSPALATPAQVRAIYSIARDHGSLGENEVDEKSTALFGVTPPELSRKQASDFITSLKGSR